MAGEKRGSGSSKTPNGKRRRPRPTIDLTATEIPSEPSAAVARADADAPPPAETTSTSSVDAPPAAEATVTAAAAESDPPGEADTSPEPSAPPPPASSDAPVVTTQPAAEPTTLASASTEAPPSASTAERPPDRSGEQQAKAAQDGGTARSWTSSSTDWMGERTARSSPLMGAAVGAGAAALIAIGVIAGLWKTGVMAAHDERLPSLAARVGELERQLQQFAARPALASDERIAEIAHGVFENAHVIEAVNQRLTKAELQLAAGAYTEEHALPQVKELHARLAAEFGHIIDIRVANLLNAERASQQRELEQRLAKVEEAARATGGGPAAQPARADDSQVLSQVKELETRLAAIETSLRTVRERGPETRATGRAAEAEAALRSLAEAAAALRRRVDEVAGLAQAANDAAAQSSGALSARSAEIAGSIEGINRRMAALEDALKGVQAAMARPSAPDVDRAARFAVAVLALRAKVERGDPFVAELAAVKPLVADQASLVPLETFAATGVPETGALARELSSLASTLRRAADSEPRGGGVLERLQAGAGKLVRVRPVDAPATDAGDAIAKLEVQTARGDLAGALAAVAQLPAAERTAFEPWIRKAQGRTSAVEQADELARAALDALGKTR